MKNILLAEDDKIFGAILQSELEDEEYHLHLVHDGVEAVLSFLGRFYDLVLLDIRMPRLNGLDALHIMRKINPHIPAITFSAQVGSREREESDNAGALKCLSKPFEIAQLKEEIRSCLRR